MKVIKRGMEPVAHVLCSCCQEDHSATFEINKNFTQDEKRSKEWNIKHPDEDVLYITIKDIPRFRFFQRLKQSWDFLINTKSYFFGKNIVNNGIIIHTDEIEELYNTLKPELIKYNIISEDEFKEIENGEYKFPQRKYPITCIQYNFETKKKSSYISDKEFTWIAFNNDSFVVHTDIDIEKDKRFWREIVFGYRLSRHEVKDRRYIRREAWRYIFKKDYAGFIGGEYEGFMSKKSTIRFLELLQYFIQYTN